MHQHLLTFIFKNLNFIQFSFNYKIFGKNKVYIKDTKCYCLLALKCNGFGHFKTYILFTVQFLKFTTCTIEQKLFLSTKTFNESTDRCENNLLN